ncbi:SH3 domain-containing protein [Dongia sedimenti]|uniref:SH3 domain-containing protein n=1 Tax=Dongia sedimenti TaxID=3064282 RepID=A0ABU0YPR8_9PROT|nr:SH3 domain-containing protein [Rhodospirillaceae bacterium R-7]
MSNTHPITVLASVMVAAVVLTAVSYFASGPHGLPPHGLPPQALTEAAGPPHGGPAATPNHDPHPVSLEPGPIAAAVATPNHDPHRVTLTQRPTAVAAATPNHDPDHLRPAPSLALNAVALRAEPEAVVPSAADFVDADTMLYAKDSARLRKAPSTTADVVTKLAADAPLRAVARSTDRAWWRVSLADGRVGYVHRTAVTRSRVVQSKPPSPVVAVAARPPVTASRSQGLLGYVDQTMNWLTDAAARGSPAAAARTER